ncbi:hypothetical protein [uncultured Prevotella sp.]|uniref:hypothetical protein n=1 Tax=uncultured Prevotella sp. TaxID=159272 RepID=UPI00259B0EDD|nr:hypothetical protein [uncultured Prevotella sp.]
MFYTQRITPIVPSEEVRSYPANGYEFTQRMGTMLPSSWVQDDPTAGYKTYEKDIKMMLIY